MMEDYMDTPDKTSKPAWSLDDIDWDRINVAAVHDDEFLFVTLASASFVEILSETYSGNLVQHFHSHPQATQWLAQSWQQDEVRHGHAFKRYVQTVWPEFDWEASYQQFKAEYTTYCTVDQLEPEPALEMVARCVVETGTSTFYRALYDYTSEPVLRQITSYVKADEIAHYTHFRKYFSEYNAIEKHGVWAVLRTIWRQLREMQGEDAYIAYKHVYQGLHPGKDLQEADWHRYNRAVKKLARRYYSFTMAVRMLLKPVPVRESIKQALHWPLVGLARLVSFAA
jgi:hypothetical protein